MAKILVVEDSASMRALVTSTLRAASYEVIEAADGVAGLEAAKSETVDLVLTDINMPRMDGLAMIEALRQLPAYAYTPILLLTTEQDASRKQRAKAAGASGWVVKPFEPKKLVSVIARFAAA